MVATGRRRGGDQCQRVARVDMSRGAAVLDPTPPRAGLGKSGRQVWTSAVESATWLKPTDIPALLTLCHLEDELVQARTEAAKLGPSGLYIPGYSGSLHLHPVVKHIREIEKQRMALFQTLGFTPLDRVRLGIEEIQAMDELEAFRERSAARRASQAVS